VSHSSSLMQRLSPCVELRFPGFERHYEVSNPKSVAYAFEPMRGVVWYTEFVDRILRAQAERRFLPVYRMCDGEFIFALGGHPEDKLPWRRLSPGRLVKRVLRRLVRGSGHRTGTNEYGYESYSAREREKTFAIFVSSLKFIADKGILALCLQNTPLAQPFIPAICDWFDLHHIPLHRQNYHHFYSIYVLLHGPDRVRLLRNRRVLVVTGLTNEKRLGIEAGLRSLGVSGVEFVSVSRSRAMLDVIDLTSIRQPVDVALIGAGVGAANILAQLEPLGTVCLDVGFALSTLADRELRWNRPYCVPDEEFDRSRVRWLK